MSELKTLDKSLQDLAAKVLGELPDELAKAAHFLTDEKDAGLILDFPFKLEGSDIKLIAGILTKCDGSFANRKVNGEDSPYFVIPKPRSAAESQVTKSPGNQVTEAPKQPSPLSLFREKYCKSCDDQGTCRLPSNAVQMQICVSMLKVQVQSEVSERLLKLEQALKQSPKVSLPVQPEKPAAATTPQSKPETVQRNTRPTEGHIDQGIIWTNEVGSKGEYEKAIEKDNKTREDFYKLYDWVKAASKPFKDGFYYWVFDKGQDLAIGRKKTKKAK